MFKEIILVGAFHEVIELCEDAGYTIIGIIDKDKSDAYLGYSILGDDTNAKLLYEHFSHIPLVIAPDSPSIREKLVKIYSEIGFSFETIISPFAKISKYAFIGEGAIIQSGVNISAFAHIGKFAKLNTNCNIMHESVIGNYTTIAPNAVILGRIKIGEKSYIGANATILPEKIIGNLTIIGAGSVVTKDIEDNKTVKGIPAK